jgi:hypothetical protein
MNPVVRLCRAAHKAGRSGTLPSGGWEPTSTSGSRASFGGCWCIGYHPECGRTDISHRAVKEERVRMGRAHAALVFDADGLAQGWCQYGSPDELSNITHRREYGFRRGRQVGKHAWIVSRQVAAS